MGQDKAKVNLGTSGRIREDALQCQLCSLFYDIIRKQGATYQHRSVYKKLDSNDVHFRADPDLCYYARIHAPDTNINGSFLLCRLSLTAHKVLSPDLVIAYLDNVIQIYDSGILKPPTEASTVQARRTEDEMVFGGRKRPPTIDIQLVRRWMRNCVDEHAGHCSSNSVHVDNTHMDLFRVIDIRDQSILELNDVHLAEFQFIALSYVWGTTPTVRLMKATRPDLQRFRALRKLHLPRAIADSMSLAELLGFRDLWVDTICIIQDSPVDQGYQIGKMTTVFSLAVIAASVENSSAGLPGLRSPTQLYEQKAIMVVPPSETHAGLSLMNTLRSHIRHWDQYFTRGQENADFSKWSQRALKLQERALSGRILVFTDEEVFRSCRQAYFCEESYFEVPSTMITLSTS